MAITFNNTAFASTQSAVGVLNGNSFTGVAEPIPLNVSISGAVNGVGSGVDATFSDPTGVLGSNTVLAAYQGYSGTDTDPVYYFSTGDALTYFGVTGFAVSSTGTVPTVGVATTITTADAPCFVRGTRILTDRGEVAVEDLRAGDLVATAAQGASPAAPAFRPVRFVGSRSCNLTVAHSDASRPVRVRAGALGDGLPHRDLRLSGDHALFLDGQLVPVKFLVNGSSIAVETGLREVTYFHVELDTHDVLIAEGAPSESWLDNGNRVRFTNAGAVALHAVGERVADAAPRAWNEGACAPHLLNGPALDALRARLDAVGEQLAATAPAIAPAILAA